MSDTTLLEDMLEARARMQDVADILLCVARELEARQEVEAEALATEVHNYALHNTAALSSFVARLQALVRELH